jgi:hypothetical protein
VTCVDPSDRFEVPSFAADTPAPAFGEPEVVTGSHIEAHAPLQVLIAPVSFENVYRVRP